MMELPHVIYENPGKVNIAYSVHYMEKDKSVEDYFQWLVDEIKLTKTKATRTINVEAYIQETGRAGRDGKQCGIYRISGVVSEPC